MSAVVVNFNGLDLVEECLRSLLEQSRPLDQVIVVDNASTDGSPDLIARAFPQVELLRSSRNLGYAAACNAGWRHSRGELVAVLNNDLVLDRLWLEKLLEAATPPYDFWASRILMAADPNCVDSAGDAMAVVGTAYKIGHRRPVDPLDAPREVFGPCGAAALYSRSLLEQTGGFDEDFFLVYEDADLSFRARLLGFRCLFVPEAVVHHHVNYSIGTLSHTYVYFGHRNSEFVYWQNMPMPLVLLYLPERLLFDAACLAYFLFKGKLGPFARAKLDFLTCLPKVLKKRRKVQAARRISGGQLKAMLDRNWFRHRLK